MDVNTISEMQSDMSKIIEEMEKQLNLPPHTGIDQDLPLKSGHSVDERRFSMYDGFSHYL